MRFLTGAILFIGFIISGCSSTKKIETTAPFSLGEPYAQKWTLENDSVKEGHEVVIPILSLEKDRAELKNLYYMGKRAPLQMKLTSKGNVAVAEFGDIANESVEISQEDEPFPFQLSETQAVVSYVNNEKVKYFQINGIQRNLAITYPNLEAKNSQ
tara:strand:+ start:197 stop:664 length:468 start_codon:yes stop_codon:yes gene_type:complete